MRKLALLAVPAALLLAVPASAHDATGIVAALTCGGQYTVTVGYEDFSDGHRLVTTIDTGKGTVVHTETPTGAGTEHYAGSGASKLVITVTTPDDDNAPLTYTAKKPTGCATPHPTPPATSKAGAQVLNDTTLWSYPLIALGFLASFLATSWRFLRHKR